jgi:putative ABC transport system substrate-binding protein
MEGPITINIARRKFIAALDSAAVAWPVAARAQQTAMPVVGFLSSGSPDESKHLVAAFCTGLRTGGGYVEGQNVAIQYRWAEGQYGRLPELAADLVRRGVAVIVAAGGESSALAAKAATSTIPIIFSVGGDPVKSGLVASISHPGGNATGVSLLTEAPEGKRLGLLKELAPNATVFGVLIDPNYPGMKLRCGMCRRRLAQSVGKSNLRTPQTMKSWRPRSLRSSHSAQLHCSLLPIHSLIRGEIGS